MEEWISVEQVLAATTMSQTTLWRRIKDGTFPPPIKLGPQLRVWRKVEFENWQRKQIEERNKTFDELPPQCLPVNLSETAESL